MTGMECKLHMLLALVWALTVISQFPQNPKLRTSKTRKNEEEHAEIVGKKMKMMK